MLSHPNDAGKETMEAVSRYFNELEHMVWAISLDHLERILRLLKAAYLEGHRIFIMGNCGSAATASHFALDLLGIPLCREHHV